MHKTQRTDENTIETPSTKNMSHTYIDLDSFPKDFPQLFHVLNNLLREFHSSQYKIVNKS